MSHLKILCTGDLHLGRTSSKSTKDDENASDYSVRNVWARIVDCAIQHDVNLFLLSGDIADDESNQYEAMGPFEDGIARLADHDIQVFLITGNHDARTLPLLVSICSNSTVHLLGQGGNWEQMEWPVDGPPQVSLVGWSYPGGQVRSLPIAKLSPQSHIGVPVIAIAHSDYRTSGSSYAPISIEALRGVAGVDMWLLGHIHVPEKIEGSPLILNPGSPQALDPRELGQHGPWIVEVDSGHIINVEQIPLSTVAYYKVQVDVTAMKEEEELVAFLLPTLKTIERECRRDGYRPRLSYRLDLTGRTMFLDKLYENRKRILQEQPLLDYHGYFIEQITLSAISPAYDLQKLSERRDSIGALAQMACALAQPRSDEKLTPYLRGVDEVVQRICSAPAYQDGVPQEGLPSTIDLLKIECQRLLEELLRQEERRP